MWERQKGVCTHEPLFLFMPHACVSPAQNRESWGQILSPPWLTQSRSSLLFFIFYFLSPSHLLSFTLTHPPAITAGTVEGNENCYTLLHSAALQASLFRMWTFLLGVIFGLLASSRSAQLQGEEPFCLTFSFFLVF